MVSPSHHRHQVHIKIEARIDLMAGSFSAMLFAAAGAGSDKNPFAGEP
jgi:hypothetical protein